MKFLLSKNFIFYASLVMVAIISGVVIGDIYVSSLPAEIDMSSLSETELRGDQYKVTEIYEQAISGKKKAFNGLELYQIAERKLNNTKNYVKVMTGEVTNSVTGKQLMRSNKLVTEEEMVYQKISPSSGGPAPTISARINYKNGNIYVNKSGVITGSSVDDLKISFDDSKNTIMSEGDYKTNFNTSISSALPYIISEYTCAEGNYDKNITLDSDGTYKFKINISGNYLSLAAYYYAYEIRYYSGFNVLPSWLNLEMEVVVDSNFNFVSIKYIENYTMLIFINASVQDVFVDKFYFDDATINAYKNEIGTIKEGAV